jgi:hypothetical protein
MYRFEPLPRLGLSFGRAHSHHRTGIDRHPLRPNGLLTLRVGPWCVNLFWPRGAH